MNNDMLPNFGWLIERRLAGMAYPRAEATFAALRRRGVRAVVTLTEEPLSAAILARYGLRAAHLPLVDFAAPTVAQAAAAVAAIVGFLDAGSPVVVHCGAGLGRTGTILACYRVWQGDSAAVAIAEVRARRPGSIETAEQEAAVAAYADALRTTRTKGDSGMQRPDWSIDEFAHAGDEHLDPAYIATYDRKAATDPTEDVALLRDLGLDASRVLLDLGAGTGTLALAAAPFCRRVVAVDVSPAMLAVIRAKAEQSGLSNVEVVQGGFLGYHHEGDPPDVVYSRNALHHLPDFWKGIALARVAAMLRPGGVLFLRDLVFSFDPSEANDVIEAWLAGAAARPEEGWTRDELATHVREEYSTFSWLLEPLLERTGFMIREAHHRPSRTYGAYICVKR